MMPVRHYYHVYAAGAWSQPVREHFDALGQARFDGMDMTVGLVGREEDRERAKEAVDQWHHLWGLRLTLNWAEADDGWEQVTLQQIYHDVHQVPGEFAVLYCHTKGAYNNSDPNISWRRSMTRKLVGSWRECARLLNGYDAVGCHWIKAPEWPEQVPFFAGNFWWARASYLRTLPEPENETRWTPETWVSLRDPKICDVLPGYPAYE